MTKEQLLTDKEIETIILNLAEGQGMFTEEEAEIAVDWATKTRLDEALLSLVLKGDALLSIVDGEVAFKISPKGIERVTDDDILDEDVIG